MKILILGGSHRDIPLIDALQKLGHYVITLGDRDYYIGHKFADKYYKLNFNDLASVEKVIKKEKIDYIVSGSGEESLYNSALLAKKFNLGNYDDMETVKLVHNKKLFKDFCKKNLIPVPEGGDDYTKLKFPVIIKPQNLSGGRGVRVVYSEKELLKELEYSKRFSEKLIFEEFIEGEIIAYSVIIKNRRVYYEFCAKDQTYLNPYLISTASTEDLDTSYLKQAVNKIAQKLGFVDGPFHLQVIKKKNEFYIMDVTRRIAGDLFPYLIEYSDGVNYSEMVVKAYMNQEFEKKEGNKKYVIRHCVMPDKNGVFEGVECCLDYKLRLDLLKKGDKITDYKTTHTNIFIFEFDDINEMKEKLKNINGLVYAKVKD
jgi:biotin carboxylase